MDRAMSNAEILTRILRERSQVKYPLHPGVKVVSSCDRESGQFLLVRIGWDEDEWFHSILFHAQLIDGQIVIEADMTEGLKPLLVEAGVRAEDIISGDERDRQESALIAA
jgi:hypothetical protein